MSLMNSSLIVGDLNIANLSDGELAKCLMEQGFNPGPIIASTRSVYERKLARLLRNESFLETNEENGLDAEVLPNPILSSTMRESPAPFQPPSPPIFQPTNNYDIDFDDLRRRPLPRLDNSYSPSYESWRRPISADDIVSQATPPPPPEPESPMMSPLVKLILLVCAVIFMVFVYYNMEATPDNPFTSPPDTSA